MLRSLKGTTAQGVQNAITEARHRVGGVSGMVFTLVVITDHAAYPGVLASCVDAGREHPSRIIVVMDEAADADRLDADIRLGEDAPGEIITLRFHGELTQHRASVVLPLLLPDSPVIAWWPGEAPASLADDPLGRLASRRISDTMGTSDPLSALAVRAAHLAPGDTDLAWTRLTQWRALLTASLDQTRAKVTSVTISAAQDNAAAVLLSAWFDDRIGCEIIAVDSSGPGITSVEMTTTAGVVSITRAEGMMARFSAPNTPKRTVALRRRTVSELLSEELRRPDPDDILQSAMAKMLQRASGAGPVIARLPSEDRSHIE